VFRKSWAWAVSEPWVSEWAAHSLTKVEICKRLLRLTHGRFCEQFNSNYLERSSGAEYGKIGRAERSWSAPLRSTPLRSKPAPPLHGFLTLTPLWGSNFLDAPDVNGSKGE